VFGFWNWVGGRYSVSSAVGLLPLSIIFGKEQVDSFVRGMNSMDKHFEEAPMDKNIPVLLGLIGWYNTHIAGHGARAILPYCQALIRFAAHIQQVDMESNGKGVTKGGIRYGEGVETSPIIFGEPGTNGQHSFYQLMHQGRTVPAEFIGYAKSQYHIENKDEVVTNH
jgi:glucose-6-phosphate isomerase